MPEELKPVLLPLSGKLITAKDPMTISEGDFQELTNMRYKRKNPVSILGMTKFNTATVVDGTASPGTYMKTRQGFHFKKDTPTDIGGGTPEIVDMEGWSVTIEKPVAYTARICTKLAVDIARNTFYVSVGAIGLRDGNYWVIYKRSLETGAKIWDAYIYGAANSCIFDIFYYSNYLYALGFYSNHMYVAKITLSSTVESLFTSSIGDGRGAALHVDSSGVYTAIWNNVDDLWYIEKFNFSGDIQWTETSDHSMGYPHKIVADDTHIYVFGGGAEWVAEKRLKSDGSLVTSRTGWNLGSGSSILCACAPTATDVTVAGHDYGDGYRARIERLSLTDFSTSVSTYVDDDQRSESITGIDRDGTSSVFAIEGNLSADDINVEITKNSYSDLSESIRVEDINTYWSGVGFYGDIKFVEKSNITDSILLATPTFSSTGGSHADIRIQRRFSSTLEI